MPIKLIQLCVYELAEGDTIKPRVISKLIKEDASAKGRTMAVFLKNSSDRPVRIGIRRIISSIMGSDCQYENDK